MAAPRLPEPVKPICGILLADLQLFAAVEDSLARLFGSIEDRSLTMRWDWSDYYAAEMGPHLWRCWYSFRDLRLPDALVSWKLVTNRIEMDLAVHGRRRVNIDPGYIATMKLVLATTKDAPHRIYVGQGIYAEVTLTYERGEFRPLPHTYPDYAAAESRSFFTGVRLRYLQQRRARLS